MTIPDYLGCLIPNDRSFLRDFQRIRQKVVEEVQTERMTDNCEYPESSGLMLQKDPLPDEGECLVYSGEKLLNTQPTDGKEEEEGFISCKGKGIHKINLNQTNLSPLIQSFDGDKEQQETPVKDQSHDDLESSGETFCAPPTDVTPAISERQIDWPLDMLADLILKHLEPKKQTPAKFQGAKKSIGHQDSGHSSSKVRVAPVYHPYQTLPVYHVTDEETNKQFLLAELIPTQSGPPRFLKDLPRFPLQETALDLRRNAPAFSSSSRVETQAEQEKPMDLSTYHSKDERSNDCRLTHDPGVEFHPPLISDQLQVETTNEKESDCPAEKVELETRTSTEEPDKARTPEPSRSFQKLAISTVPASPMPNLSKLGMVTEDNYLPQSVGIMDKLRKKIVQNKMKN